MKRMYVVLCALMALAGLQAVAGPGAPHKVAMMPAEAALTVRGKVTDEAGEPLIGASILVKGTGTGTITDFDGAYELEVADETAVLVFSYTGYENVEEVVGSRQVIDVVLRTGITLEQVVVVGYGVQKKSDVTGSVTSVPKERLSELPVTNVLQSIQGAVAGVNITQGSSVPGSGSSALVRGVNSISAATGPFIVLDGMPFSTTGGSLNDINPNDIASIEILKDASAVAIYGTRGANGVILITTKRGSSGKPVIKLNTYAGSEGFAHVVEPMGPEEYVQKYADWKAQAGSSDPAAVPNIYEQQNLAAGRTTDWLEAIRQNGHIQNHNLSVSGGSESVRYFISGDYLKQQGVIKGYQYNRASLRSNIDAKINSFLDAGFYIFLTSNNYDGGRANLRAAGQMSPYGTLLRDNGDYEIFPMFAELVYTTPLLGLNTTRNERSQNINTNAYLSFKPGFAPGLEYKVNAAYSFVPTQNQEYIGRKANNLVGAAQVANTETKNWVIENILTYNRSWGSSNLGVTALFSAQETNFFSSRINATGFINDVLAFNNLGTASSVAAASDRYRSNLLSQMIRVNYGYDSRYLLTFTARRDGYSAFGANTSKYGVFPSVALGWNIDRENFMRNATAVDALKLRVSYGLSGNQAIDPNTTTSTFGTARLPFNGVSTIGVLASVLGNANLSWESTLGTNVGVDFELFKGRIGGAVEAYATNTKDLLLFRAIPEITGYDRVLDNLGEVANRGLEITLRTQNYKKGDFRWESNLNFATNRNRIVDLYGDKKDDVGNRWFIGQPVNVVFDYLQTGIWQTGEDVSSVDPTAKPGDIKFEDINGDGVITPADRVVLGQVNPKWIGGLTNTFHYKQFHLNVFIQTVQGVTKNNPLVDYRDLAGRENLPSGLGYWTAANQNSERPSLAFINARLYNYPTDASFVRLKDVTLSYVFRPEAIDKAGLSSLTLYCTGRNLYTWTNWFGWDPEVEFNRELGANTNNYPLVRTFIIGANIGLK